MVISLTNYQAEYANILHKRVAEAKSQQQEMKKRRASSMRK
jgi:small subunit ribosomal protein S6e